MVFCKIIIKRISAAVNKMLRRNIIEPYSECQKEMCINFVDFEKAFDNIHRDSLWRIQPACGSATHIVDIIKPFYENYTCTISQSDITFMVNLGVRKGCVKSAVLFNLVIDWNMKRTTEGPTRRIRWTTFSSHRDI